MGCIVNHSFAVASRERFHFEAVRNDDPVCKYAQNGPNTPNGKRNVDIMMMAHIRFAFQTINYAAKTHACAIRRDEQSMDFRAELK